MNIWLSWFLFAEIQEVVWCHGQSLGFGIKVWHHHALAEWIGQATSSLGASIASAAKWGQSEPPPKVAMEIT